jgi:hypothetical protein
VSRCKPSFRATFVADPAVTKRDVHQPNARRFALHARRVSKHALVMSAEMDSRTSTFERTLFPRGCQANIACLRAGGLRHSQHIFGVRTHADDTFSHLLDDDRIDDAASPPRVICCMA